MPFGIIAAGKGGKSPCISTYSLCGTGFAHNLCGGSFKIMKNLKKVASGAAVAFALAFGFILMSSTNATAQYRDRDYRQDDRYNNQDRDRDYDRDRRGDNDDRYNGRDRRGNESLRFAYQKGYNDGLRQVMRDARRNRGGYGNYGGYGNNGGWNNSRNGDWRYREAYQRGFSRGYQDGLNRNRRRDGGIFGF
jgi:hypothetical protein